MCLLFEIYNDVFYFNKEQSVCFCSQIDEDLPELDMTVPTVDGTVEFVLSTEFNCPDESCLDSSTLLFSATYDVATETAAAAKTTARNQCALANGATVVTYDCS